MSTVKKPVTLRIADLSRTVQQAVANHPAEKGFHLGPIIMGIILRPPIAQFEEANHIATHITQQVHAGHGAALAGTQLQPAVLSRPGGPIICGFIAENITLQE